MPADFLRLNGRCQGEGGTLTSVNLILLYRQSNCKYFTLIFHKSFQVVPRAGIEPTTLALGVPYSIHLSYRGEPLNYTSLNGYFQRAGSSAVKQFLRKRWFLQLLPCHPLFPLLYLYIQTVMIQLCSFLSLHSKKDICNQRKSAVMRSRRN